MLQFTEKTNNFTNLKNNKLTRKKLFILREQSVFNTNLLAKSVKITENV